MPLTWLVTITSTAALHKLFNPEPRIGFLAHARQLGEQLASGALPPEKAAQIPQLIFNDRLDAVLTVFFFVTTWVLVLDTIRVCYLTISGRRQLSTSETPYVRTQLVTE